MTAKKGLSTRVLNTYTWPVDVRVPFVNEAGEGDFEVHRFTGTFKLLSAADARALFERLQAGVEQSKEELSPDDPMYQMEVAERVTQYQIDLYMDIWQGWGTDLTDEHGDPLPCNEATRRQLLGQRIIREAVIAAHQDSQGGELTRRKNSVISPVAGPATGGN